MAIIEAADVSLRLGATDGPGNSHAAGSAGNSVGPFMSSTEMTTTNLFQNITGTDNANSVTDYQVVFIYNTIASGTNADGMENTYVWFSTQVAGGADATMWLDTTGAVAYNSADNQCLTVADSHTAPAGADFVAAASSDDALSVGTIAPQQCVALWIKRQANNTTAMNSDGFSISISYDTSA